MLILYLQLIINYIVVIKLNQLLFCKKLFFKNGKFFVRNEDFHPRLFNTAVSEIQFIEIANGDVIHNLSIPVYMMFPRLFCCPTMETINFKIAFELNIAILFTNDVVITENFPLRLTRF